MTISNYDESGNACTKQDVLNNLQSGAIRYVSMISIRLLSAEVAIVHGSEEDEVEQVDDAFLFATSTRMWS